MVSDLEKFVRSGFASPEFYEAEYRRYLKNPELVEASWRALFARLEEGRYALPELPEAFSTRSPEEVLQALRGRVRIKEEATPDSVRILELIETYRIYGHLGAWLNPLLEKPSKKPPELELAVLGFQQQDLKKAFPTCGLSKEETLPLEEIVRILEGIYCQTIAYEYMGIHSPELEEWLQEQIEGKRYQLTIEEKQLILQQLNRSSLFERFLQTKYVGQKRFSLEGAETLIPMLGALVEKVAKEQVDTCVIGMSHRGRLNVLCNILDKSYAQVFGEFDDPTVERGFSGSGDVKYHKGYTSQIKTIQGEAIKLILAANPSHLESVNPVVEGITRALQDLHPEKGTLPILIHGDAALSGQGVVYETLQFCRLPGYQTKGTVHLVINNQIGFTTTPEESRSTKYCTDIAKAFNAPIFHVNGEDPEACVFAILLAVDIRRLFGCDVFIDLMCYRKYGHNESDEPAFTQPLEYQIIRQKSSIREIYRDHLIQEGVVEKVLAESLEEEFKKGLQAALKNMQDLSSIQSENEKAKKEDKSNLAIATGVPFATLEQIAEAMSVIPKGFSPHPKLIQVVQNRLDMVKGRGKLDWGAAEGLAYGSLLIEGTRVRLSGQDVQRGTFSHRHAVWMDQKRESKYFPLQHLTKGQGIFEAYNSSLSEMGVLGFEFGYSTVYPNALVIWEAQFGDFSNGAQIIIDQYLATSEQKWASQSNLVLFLPHGYEGQGPEHSSARIERYLILCAEDNMTAVNPTTPAQLFHLLRRHIKGNERRPLIVFTPKELLRHPLCVSPIEEFIKGHFLKVVDDPKGTKKGNRLAFCSGRLYYDLMEEREKVKDQTLNLVRVEQLYPFPEEEIRELLKKYREAKEVFWVQEEPENMGAWSFIKPRLETLLPEGMKVKYVGREASASPATGSHKKHRVQHQVILRKLFEPPKQMEIDVRMMHPI